MIVNQRLAEFCLISDACCQEPSERRDHHHREEGPHVRRHGQHQPVHRPTLAPDHVLLHHAHTRHPVLSQGGHHVPPDWHQVSGGKALVYVITTEHTSGPAPATCTAEATCLPGCLRGPLLWPGWPGHCYVKCDQRVTIPSLRRQISKGYCADTWIIWLTIKWPDNEEEVVLLCFL